MNAKEYLSNPMGKGSSILMLNEARRILDSQYEKIVSKITLKWYSYSSNHLVAHVKIPSRSAEGLMYDVLLEFNLSSVPENITTIDKASLRVFSNCPSFTYTYANIFDKQGDLINWTKTKYSKKIFELDPKIRNPHQIRSYERSLYFAIKYITSNGRNYKHKIDYNHIKVDGWSNILNKVEDAESVVKLYKIKKAVVDDRKSKETAKPKTNTSQPLRHKNTKGYTKTTANTKKTKKTSSTKKMKKL